MDKQRNHYYHGKLLKSEDFTCEQQYMLNQFMVRTHAILGEGIVYGLHIKEHSNEMICIQAGCAFDAQGHLIELEKDQILSLEELQGFFSLSSSSCWLCLHYKETATGKEFCEFSDTEDHQMFGKWEDQWEVSIQEERIPNNLEKQLFHKEILYEDALLKLSILIPTILPAKGDVCLRLQLESQKSEHKVKVQLHSTHYQIQDTGTILVEKNNVYEMKIPLHRKDKAGGHYATFTLDQMMLDEHVVSPCFQNFEIEIVENFEMRVMEQLRKQSLLIQNDVVLGYVEFCYEQDHLIIKKLEEAERMECRRPQLDTAYEILMKMLQYKEKEVTSLENEPLKEREAFGSIIFQCDETKPVFHSEEIFHGLGCTEVQIQLSFELSNRKEAAPYQKMLLTGDTSLFMEKGQEAIRWAVRVYPWKGSFQAAVCVPKHFYKQRIKLYWYAKAWEMEPVDSQVNHLIRINPTILLCKPKETNRFTAVFDKEDNSKEIRYVLKDERGGELCEDGTFHAGDTEGMYQIQAYYHDQEVNAYVKVSREDE